MHGKQHFGIVITQMGSRKDIVQIPWLEQEYRIEESDWIVLSNDGWRAVAAGDPAIWHALERKLLVGFYVNQPQLVVVIGHPSEGGDDAEVEQRQQEVKRIVQGIRSLLLPTGVMGVWTDERGALQDILEPAECDEQSLPSFSQCTDARPSRRCDRKSAPTGRASRGGRTPRLAWDP